MTTYQIVIRGRGMVWKWGGVTDEEMRRIILAVGCSPDGVDAAGDMFVEFRANQPYRGVMPCLSPAVVRDVLGRPAVSCLKDQSEGHGGS